MSDATTGTARRTASATGIEKPSANDGTNSLDLGPAIQAVELVVVDMAEHGGGAVG